MVAGDSLLMDDDAAAEELLDCAVAKSGTTKSAHANAQREKSAADRIGDMIMDWWRMKMAAD